MLKNSKAADKEEKI